MSRSDYSIRYLSSVTELRANSSEWNRLWDASDCGIPSARAEIVATWVESFGESQQFMAVVVEHSSRFVGAIPLIDRRISKLFKVGGLPCNAWAASGDLLLDVDCDQDAVLTVLARGIRDLPWKMLVLDRVAIKAARWVKFRNALSRAGLVSHSVLQHQIAQVEIGSDWAAYERSLKGRHRQRRRRNTRMLERAGRVEFRLHSSLAPCDVESLMKRGFGVEDKSWKGRSATSVLSNRQAFRYYVNEARELASSGHLELAFLECDGEPISFCYGWNAKHVRFSVKIGYDEAFSRFGPGQQQCMRLLEYSHQDPGCVLYDFYGRLMPWNEMWATRTYDVSRLLVTHRIGTARIFSSLYARLHPHAKRLRSNIWSKSS